MSSLWQIVSQLQGLILNRRIGGWDWRLMANVKCPYFFYPVPLSMDRIWSICCLPCNLIPPSGIQYFHQDQLRVPTIDACGKWEMVSFDECPTSSVVFPYRHCRTPHLPGRPLRINFMSRYICFSQIGPFDVCFEELFSKVQNPGGFFRKIVF